MVSAFVLNKTKKKNSLINGRTLHSLQGYFWDDFLSILHMHEAIPPKDPPKGLVVAAFLALYFIWGSTYLANIFVLESLPPFLMVGLRFLIAGAILYAWLLVKGEKKPSFGAIAKSSFSGVMMLFLGTGAVVWSEQYLPSGLAAIIVATVPLWFVALDKREWKVFFTNKGIVLGLLIGFIGVVLLFARKGSVDFSNNKMNLVSALVLLGGSMCWAIGSLYSKYQPIAISTALKAAIQMLAAGAAGLICSFITNEHTGVVWKHLSGSAVAAMVYLILIGSLVGYMSYIWLLSVRPPSLVGTYAYINPIVAVFLGWLIIDEKISSQQVVALTVILLGVILVNLSKSRKSLVVRKSRHPKIDVGARIENVGNLEL